METACLEHTRHFAFQSKPFAKEGLSPATYSDESSPVLKESEIIHPNNVSWYCFNELDVTGLWQQLCSFNWIEVGGRSICVSKVFRVWSQNLYIFIVISLL